MGKHRDCYVVMQIAGDTAYPVRVFKHRQPAEEFAEGTGGPRIVWTFGYYTGKTWNKPE